MAKCPGCDEHIQPVTDTAAVPDGGGRGISTVTWVCPECDIILGVSEVDLL